MNTLTPSHDLHWRAAGQAVRGPLRYATGACSLGMLLVARSRVGVCAILLDDHADALVQQLARAFPDTERRHDPHGLADELARAAALVDAPHAAAGMPLDLGGTDFQQRVWQALCGIPAGLTLSYTELARRIGAPLAVRAVGSACAANVLAVAIPCHRVLRSDGTITGYRWGPQRKRELLRRELGR